MFRINVPLKRSRDVEALVSAGADAFYGGLLDQGVTALNARPNPFSNFTEVADLQRAIQNCHENGATFHLTLNARVLTEADESRFLDQVRIAKDSGVDGVILANHNALLSVKEFAPDMSLAASVNFGVLNELAARQLARFGISRIILPRHLTPKEIDAIAKSCPDIEFEALILNEKCGYYDAYCGFHQDKICGLSWNDQGCSAIGASRVNTFKNNACGACFLPTFADSIGLIKVVGRRRSLESLVNGVSFFVELRNMLEAGCPVGEFKANTPSIYRKYFGVACGHDCHYERE